MSKLVSVGIPTYNQANLLKQAITSVLRQNYKNFEIIVSDDCSTDNTCEIVRSFSDPRIRYHRTEINLRPPKNWNICVRLARGEYFALLPHDDVWLPDFLEKMTFVLEKNLDVGFVQCASYRVDEQLRCIDIRRASDIPFQTFGEDALLWQMETLLCNPATLLFRTGSMHASGLWREDYWDDWAFIIKMAFRHGFVYIPDPLACIREHGYNLCRVLAREGRDGPLDIINQQADVFGEALPVTPRLLKSRSKLNRSLSYSCIMYVFRALRWGDLATARFYLERARHLNPFVVLDPFIISHILTGLFRRFRKKHGEEKSKDPIVNL